MSALVTQTLFDALLLIGLYAIGSLGFSLIWGVLNILNLTYAALITFGGYTTYALWHAGLDPLLALPVTMAITFALGWIIQRVAIDQVVNGPASLSITLTYGANMILTGLILYYFTGDPRGIKLPSYLEGYVSIAGAQLTYGRIVVIVVALGLTGAVWWFMDRTELGTAIRATRLDTEAARLVGIKVSSIYRLTASLSALLAGAMGSLAALVYSISPQMGDPLLIQLLIVSVLGGLGSIVAPLVGSVVLGLTNAAVGNMWGATYSTVVATGLVLLVLFVRPSGLLGKRFYEE
jgi:branched-chain amino acid transport system permease protein